VSKLEGQAIVVCRPQQQSFALVKAIEAAGAHPIMLPLLEVVAPADGGGALADALDELDNYDWVTFTSTNAVHAVIDELHALWPERPKVAVVGPATADLLRQSGYPVDFVSPGGTAADLAATMPAKVGQRILAPLGDRASEALESGLVSRDVVVNRVEAYRTLWAEVAPQAISQARVADFVVLTSPTIAERFAEVVEAPHPPAVCIGPTTARAAVGAALEVAEVATKRTPDGLIDALMRTIQS
jgi:uroporphyrinogen-III synthase